MTTPRILGFDAVAKVLAVGEAVTTIMTDDVVYYAGAVDRPGSDAQYQLVDERLVACAPKTWLRRAVSWSAANDTDSLGSIV